MLALICVGAPSGMTDYVIEQLLPDRDRQWNPNCAVCTAKAYSRDSGKRIKVCTEAHPFLGQTSAAAYRSLSLIGPAAPRQVFPPPPCLSLSLLESRPFVVGDPSCIDHHRLCHFLSVHIPSFVLNFLLLSESPHGGHSLVGELPLGVRHLLESCCHLLRFAQPEDPPHDMACTSHSVPSHTFII